MSDVTSARDKSMTLQPGYAHTVDASVAVMPLYVKVTVPSAQQLDGNHWFPVVTWPREDMFGSTSIATFYIELESVRIYKQAESVISESEVQMNITVMVGSV